MKKIYCIVFLAALFIVGTARSQQNVDAYEFPIKPGTENWKKLKNGTEMILACQIPPDRLQKMSTKGLVLTCLNYPLLSTMFAYDNLQDGFGALAKNFNGFQELLKRKDAGKELLKVYAKMNPGAIDRTLDESKQGSLTFQFTYVEVLLAQHSILSQFSTADKKVLVKEGLAKYKAKEANSSLFGGFGTLTSALLVGRTMENVSGLTKRETDNNSGLRSFLNSGTTPERQVIDKILDDARVFIQ